MFSDDCQQSYVIEKNYITKLREDTLLMFFNFSTLFQGMDEEIRCFEKFIVYSVLRISLRCPIGRKRKLEKFKTGLLPT